MVGDKSFHRDFTGLGLLGRQVARGPMRGEGSYPLVEGLPKHLPQVTHGSAHAGPLVSTPSLVDRLKIYAHNYVTWGRID